MAFDLIVRNATLPDGRSRQDVAIAAGRIAAIEPAIAAEAGRTIDARGYLLAPPFVDCHFHLDATLSLGLPRAQRLGHAARGDRALGRTKASSHPRSGGGAGAQLLRSCRLAGPARHSQSCRRVRRPADRGRSAHRREKEGEALSRSAARRLSAGRLFPFPERSAQPRARARPRRRRRRRHPAFRAHDGGRRGFC